MFDTDVAAAESDDRYLAADAGLPGRPPFQHTDMRVRTLFPLLTGRMYQSKRMDILF
jgi:hypothetical protein